MELWEEMLFELVEEDDWMNDRVNEARLLELLESACYQALIKIKKS